LTLGETYDFIVYSRNSHGFSLQSETLSMVCAFKPASPTNALSANDGQDAVITWTAPANNGSPITAYRVVFKTSVNTYAEELTYCDGTDATIVSG
jgi:hypothetical protein